MAATTNDAVPVTAEARAAYCDYEDLDGKYRERVMAGDWDNVAGVQAFARFERHILARHRGSTAEVEGGAVSAGILEASWDIAFATFPESSDAFKAGVLAARIETQFAALASLSQTPATPMDELQRLGQEYDGGSLGRFGHHPEPAIDFEYEVEQIESIISDLEKGMRQGEPVPLDRIERAMTFRVGGDPSAVAAKETLRRLEQRARVLSAPMVQEGFREALADPNAVHVNMLRGGIAKPSIAQIIHIYGEEAIRAALADRTQEGEVRRG